MHDDEGMEICHLAVLVRWRLASLPAAGAWRFAGCHMPLYRGHTIRLQVCVCVAEYHLCLLLC